MYAKLIDNILELAPSYKNGILNYNSEYNEPKLFEDGYKKFIQAEREENHYYNISYQENTHEIIELLEDITEQVTKAKKVNEINEKIVVLKQESINELLYGNKENIKIYQDIIKGLIETRNNLGE